MNTVIPAAASAIIIPHSPNGVESPVFTVLFVVFLFVVVPATLLFLSVLLLSVDATLLSVSSAGFCEVASSLFTALFNASTAASTRS